MHVYSPVRRRTGILKGGKIMKTTINEYQFEQAFRDAGRGDNFSYAGLQALFEYLQAYEDDGGKK